MNCRTLLIGSILAPLSLLGEGENVFVYRYDAAGNCIGRYIDDGSTVMSVARKSERNLMVEVFPLETEGDIYITLRDFNEASLASFSISSIDGTRTHNGELKEEIGIVDISSFPNGIYSLGVTYNNDLYSFKIIKK